MSCENFQEMLALQVSGDLPAAQARHLEKHLRDCRDCRDLEKRLRAGRRALIGLAAAEEAPASIRSEVLERVSAEPKLVTGLLPGWRTAGVAAAAVLVLALVLAQFLPVRTPAPLSADSAATADSPLETAMTAPDDAPDTGSLPPIEMTPPAAEFSPAADAVTAAVVKPVEPATAARPERPIVSEPASPPPPAESVVVKMLTDDPDVVIYMLVDKEGDQENA
jgi:hypothetical protein